MHLPSLSIVFLITSASAVPLALVASGDQNNDNRPSYPLPVSNPAMNPAGLRTHSFFAPTAQQKQTKPEFIPGAVTDDKAVLKKNASPVVVDTPEDEDQLESRGNLNGKTSWKIPTCKDDWWWAYNVLGGVSFVIPYHSNSNPLLFIRCSSSVVHHLLCVIIGLSVKHR